MADLVSFILLPTFLLHYMFMKISDVSFLSGCGSEHEGKGGDRISKVSVKDGGTIY